MGDVDVDMRLAALCRSEHPRLVGMLALYVGDRGIAEDLAQEALIRLHQNWSRVRTMPTPASWVTVVALNLARSWWRRRYAEQRANRRARAVPHHVRQPEPAEVLSVRAAVTALPPRQRAALLFRYYAGLSIIETAEAMGCAEGTVKSLTHRAIEALRSDLVEEEEILEPEAIAHA